MKLLFSMFLTLLMMTNTVIQAQDKNETFSAMTWNIRFNNPGDGVNRWDNRKEWSANLVRFYEPDVLGIQEGLHGQVTYLDDSLPDYSYIGVGRDDGKQAGEYSAIFYKHDKLEVLEQGTFWLSETPEQVSVGWDASMERICTWGRFRDKEQGTEFWVFNAHLDHIGPEARLESVKLIYKKVQEMNGGESLPVLVMGDLNASPDDPPIQYLVSVMSDSREVSEVPPYGPEGTFNGFDTSHPLDNRIDHIFVNEGIRVDKYAVIADTRNQRTPSDHLPVYIQFGLE